jgi:uncharacterized protein YegL
MTGRPGVQLARRPLHFFLLVDCSGSMASAGKMTALNTAVREVLPHLSETAQSNPHAEITVRSIGFATGAHWHIQSPTHPDDVVWQDLQPGGYTDLGAALDLLATVLTVPPMDERALPPAIVLVSDGMPTDDFEDALQRLHALPWAARAVRMAVAIGHDASYETLTRFIGDPELEPVTASNPEQLVMALRWATVHVARAASSIAPSPPPPAQIATAWPEGSEEATIW